MYKTKKVVTSASMSTNESSAFLNIAPKQRAIIVGTRSETTSGCGYIGKVSERCAGSSALDFAVWLDLVFPHVIGIFGTRGSGKSFDLGVVVESVAGVEGTLSGEVPGAGMIIFDMQDQFWTLKLRPDDSLAEDNLHLSALAHWGLSAQAVKNVNVWRPYGVETAVPGTEVFRLSPNQLSSTDWLAILELERYTPMGQVLLLLIEEEGNKTPRALAQRLQHSGRFSQFQSSTIDGLRWRLSSLASAELIGDPGIDVDSFLEPGLVSVLLLRQLSDSLRALAAGVLTRLLAERMAQFHQRQRVARRFGTSVPELTYPSRFWIVIDEAHLIIPSEGVTAASGPIIDYVKRGRDSGLSMLFATQQPSAVDRRLMSQVDLTITHALGFENDLQAAIARMPTRSNVSYERSHMKLPGMSEVIRSLRTGEAVIADAANGRVFLSAIRPRTSAHGGNTPE